MAQDQEILIKKVKIAAEAHGGGAWKVAYADFVTAMMAFFLLLWLLNATEQEVLDGISNYFTPTTLVSVGSSGSGGIFGGVTSNDPGPTDDKVDTATDESDTNATGKLQAEDGKTGEDDADSTGSAGPVNSEIEEKRFNTAKRLLDKHLDSLPPELQDLRETIRADVTEEGLRIQIVDNKEKAAFVDGSDDLTDHGQDALAFIANYMSRLPNKISISGHTSLGEGGENNWQLSLDRSNTARRELLKNALPTGRFSMVVGKADSELAIPENATSPANRRMVVVMIRQAPNKAAGRPQPPSLLK